MSSPVTKDGPLFRGRRPKPLRFGTSGLRGRVDDITDLEAYVNTRGFLAHARLSGGVTDGDDVALAGDLRPSTDGPDRSILRAVARAVRDAGLRPVNLGRIPTPALTLHGLVRRCPSIMVTGSHIPFDRNGIKFNTCRGEVLKDDEPGILECVDRVRREEYARPPDASPFDDGGMLRPDEASALPAATDSARQDYIRRYTDFFPAGALDGLRLVLYEHAAVGRVLTAEILRLLGATVIPMGRSDSFEALDTEAISADRLAVLQALADEASASGPVDAVISTDGDGDRPLLAGVDAGGRVCFRGGDVLGLLVADMLGADAVAVPVSATDAIERHLGPRGVMTLRTRIGSPWVVAALERMKGHYRVGWEANGGFLTASEVTRNGCRLAPLPTRDAMLPLVAVLHAARERRVSVVDLFATLPARVTRAGLVDEVPREESAALLEFLSAGAAALRSILFKTGGGVWCTDHAGRDQTPSRALERRLERLRERIAAHFSPELGFGAPVEVDLLDGVRITFENGDIAHVRPSGNAPQLRIYAIADREERAAAIVADALREPHGILRELLAAAAAA